MIEGGLWPTWLFITAAKVNVWLIITIVLVASLAGLYYVNKVKTKAK